MVRTKLRHLLEQFVRTSAIAIAIVISIRVKPAGAVCVHPPSGLVSWWPGDDNSNDIWDGNSGTLENGVTFVTGVVGDAFHFVASSTQFVRIADAPNLNFERNHPFSIDAWIQTSDTTANEFIAAKRMVTSPFTGYGILIDNGPPSCETTNPAPTGAGVLTFFLDNSDDSNCPRDHAIIVRGTSKVTDGSWHHVAVTYDGSSSAAGVKIYVDGVLETLLTESDNLAATTTTNSAPFQIAFDTTGVQPFDGDIDEFEVFDTALSASDVEAISSAGSAGKCKPVQVAGKIRISPKKINFGSVILNQTKTKILKVANAGHITKKSNPSPITVQTETESGTPTPNPFAVTVECSSDPLQPSGKGISKNETFCNITVGFTPTQATSYSGTVTIFDNLAPSGMQVVTLTGKGKAAKAN